MEFKSPEERKFYEDAFDRYLASKQKLHEPQGTLTNITQQKLDALHKAMRMKHNWHTIFFPMKAGGIGKSISELKESYKFYATATPYSKKYMPKKPTKLQKIKQKAFNEGVASQESVITYHKNCQYDAEKRLQSSRDKLTVADAKIASLSAILQSIHSTAQAGADILRIKQY